MRRQVGALLVNADGTTYYLGHNKERGGKRCDQGQCPRGQKSLEEQPAYQPYDDCVAVHAEAMVLSPILPSHLPGHTLYLTELPCSDCAQLIGTFTGLRVVVKKEGESAFLYQRPDGR